VQTAKLKQLAPAASATAYIYISYTWAKHTGGMLVSPHGGPCGLAAHYIPVCTGTRGVRQCSNQRAQKQRIGQKRTPSPTSRSYMLSLRAGHASRASCQGLTTYPPLSNRSASKGGFEHGTQSARAAAARVPPVSAGSRQPGSAPATGRLRFAAHRLYHRQALVGSRARQPRQCHAGHPSPSGASDGMLRAKHGSRAGIAEAPACRAGPVGVRRPCGAGAHRQACSGRRRRPTRRQG